MWEYNKIGVAIEHMATSIIEFNEWIIPRNNELGEKKQENYNFLCWKRGTSSRRKNSWDAHYLGANTPMDELVKFFDLIQPDLIGISLSVYSNVQFLLKEITALRTVTNIPIIIGGQGLKKVGEEQSGDFILKILKP